MLKFASINLPTYPIDQDTRKDQIEDIEHGSPPHPDGVRDVGVGLLAAAVVHHVVSAVEALQAELPVDLVVALVAAAVDLLAAVPAPADLLLSAAAHPPVGVKEVKLQH